MRMRMLGVNGPYPASNGATSGYLLETAGRMLQMDFGSGVLSRLTAYFPPEELEAILISHWHFDHTADLLPLIYRLQALGCVLPVYGPADESSAIRAIVAQADCFELRTIAAGDEFSLGDVLIQVGPARHPVPGVGYRIEAQEKAMGYTGDTNTLPELADFYRSVDLLLADALFPKSSWGEGKPHLSAALAAQLAKDAGAKRLILTHLNPAFPPEILLAEAREIFREVALAEGGRLISL